MSAAVATGCATTYPDIPPNGALNPLPPAADTRYSSRVDELQKRLTALSPGIDEQEARQVAKTAVYFTLHLANEYELTSPPIWHNVLVNAGHRKRGLCTHWAEDLLRELAELKPRSLKLNWAVANRGQVWPLEHSSVVITAIGQPFEQGLVLDGWRNSGKLYFGPVEDDRYPWKELNNIITRQVAEKVRSP